MNRAFLLVMFLFVLLLAKGGAAQPIRMPTASLQSYYEYEQQLGACSSTVLSEALVRQALHGPMDERLNTLKLASVLDASQAEPHLHSIPARLRQLNIADAAAEAFGAIQSVAGDAVQRARWVWRLQGFLHRSLAMSLMVLSLLVALRSLPFIAHVLRSRVRYPWPLLTLVAGPMIGLTILFPLIGCLAVLALLRTFMKRKERFLMAIVCLLLCAVEGLLMLEKSQVPLIDPSSHVSQLASLNSGRAQPEAARRLRWNSPRTAERELVLGLQAHRVGNFERAQEFYTESLRIDSNWAAPYLNLANLFFEQGDYAQAASGYRSSQIRAPDHALPYANLAQTYIKSMAYQEADNELRQAISLGFDDLSSHRRPWRNDAHPVLDMLVSPQRLRTLSQMETLESPQRVSDFINSARGELYRGLPAWVSVALLLGSALMLSASLRGGTWVFECVACGTSCCAHCTRSRTGAQVVVCSRCDLPPPGTAAEEAHSSQQKAQQKQIHTTETKSNWLALVFPGGADLLSNAPGSAFLNVFAALLWLGLVLSFLKTTTGSTFAIFEAPHFFFVSAGLFLFAYLPGLLRLRGVLKTKKQSAAAIPRLRSRVRGV